MKTRLPLVILSLLWSSAANLPAADWSSVSDGKADAAPLLEQAFKETGAVTLPKGTYRLSRTVEIALPETGWASLSGDGTARLVMEGAGPALHFIGTHEGSAAPRTFKPEVWEKERSPMVSGIEIIGTHAEADGIRATRTMQLTLHRTVVRDCRHAVHLAERNRNVLISDCHLYHNSGVGVFFDAVNLHQANIIGSHISYNGGGGVVSRGGNVRNLHIGTCDIEANHAAEGPPAANILLDSTDGSIGEVAVTGCTIQHTHNAPDSANIRILARGSAGEAQRRLGSEFTSEGHVTITGNVFSDVQVNIDIKDARGVVITGNTFWEGFQHDLIAERCRQLVVSANNFDRNPRYLVNGFDNAECNGLLLVSCADSSITSNVINGVWKKPAAIELRDCRRLIVSQNSVLDSDGAALLLVNVSDSLISQNLLRDDRENSKREQGPLLRVEGGAGNRIEGNLDGGESRGE